MDVLYKYIRQYKVELKLSKLSVNWPDICNEWRSGSPIVLMKDKEHNRLVTVKKGLCCHTTGTCVLHVMWRIAGARSTRRLMAIHPGASQPSRSPPHLTALSRPEERERGSAHSSWMGTLYDNHHHFPSEDNRQGSLPELDCTATRAYGANFVLRVWWEWSHEAAEQTARGFPLSLSVFSSINFFISLSASIFCTFFYLYFSLVPLITCMVSLGTCCVSVLRIESVKLESWLRIHSYYIQPHCYSHLGKNTKT